MTKAQEISVGVMLLLIVFLLSVSLWATTVRMNTLDTKIYEVKEAIMMLNSKRDADKNLKFFSNPKSDLFFFSMPDKGHVGVVR
jgi:hypothetical protein